MQNGELEYDTYIPVARTTPKFYIDVVSAHSRNIRNVDINIMKVPLASRVEHLIQNMEESDGTTYEDGKTPHGFSIDDIIKISKEMVHPKYIVWQKNGRYAEVVSFFSDKKNKQVIVSIDFAEEGDIKKNFKHEQYMNGYNVGYYNIIVTEYEPDDLASYLAKNEVVYDKQTMNGNCQVGSGCIITFTHDTPFIVQEDNTTSESKSQEVSDKKLDSDRDTSLDPRTLLTNALESVAVTDDEKTFLKAYKDQIDILNKQTTRLAEIKAEIKDISFGEGKDRSKLPGLREKARKFEQAITKKDKQLLKLEATKPLQKVLDREKAAVKKKALQKGREDLKTFKKKGTAEERTEKASEASLMPPEGVYLYAERDFVTYDEVAKRAGLLRKLQEEMRCILYPRQLSNRTGI